jgi:type II secretory pathway predicted ATPase ExeA
MYEQFYSLKQMPFALTPDPGFLYLARDHMMSTWLLRYALAHEAGLAVITGEVGSGKTTLIRHLLGTMDDKVVVGLVWNTHAMFGNLLRLVTNAFGLASDVRDSAALHEAFVNFLLEQYAGGKRVLLIVDEAQNLDVESLEVLRLLSNINADKHFVLQTILTGQPELRDTLRRHELRQLAQRIVVNHHINPLRPHETHCYVRHRLRVGGGDPGLFEAEAIDAAHDASGGIPRLINNLCDTALVYGFAEQQPRISLELMAQVIADRRAGGLFPETPQRLNGNAIVV